MKPIRFKIINITGGTLSFKKPVFDFSLLYSRKNGLRRKGQKFVHWILRLSNRD